MGDVLRLSRSPVEIGPDQDYVALGMRSFGKGVIRYAPAKGSELTKLRHFSFGANALALSNIKAWEGAIAVTSQEDAQAIASSRFLFYVPQRDEVDVRYLRHYFLSSRGLTQIGQASPGSADRNRTLSMKAFEDIVVPLPDLIEQRRVADKLDAAMDRWAALQSLRGNMSGLQADLHESMIHSALESADDVVRMGNVVRLARTEIHITPDESYRTIGMRGFGRGIIHYQPTPGDELGKLRFYVFPEGALALSNIKAWEGAISVTSAAEDGYIASNRFLFYVPVNDRVNVSYLRHYLLGRQGLAQVSACSPGAADRNRTLGVKRFEEIEFKLPPRKIQDRVAATLDAVNERLSAAYAEPTLASLRPALLNAAFSGRL
ncbi:restriction endonuclease subunit S [Streptomyces atratus]